LGIGWGHPLSGTKDWMGPPTLQYQGNVDGPFRPMDATWKEATGRDRTIRTSQALIDEASYPIMLNQEVDSRTAKGDRIIDGMFEK